MAQTLLNVLLLGTPELSWNNEALAPRSKKGLALLCYLAAQAEPVERENLVELLWKPGKAASLRQELYSLRDLSDIEIWLSDDDPVELFAQTDLAQFETAIAEGRFEDAVALWRGSFLEDIKVRAAPAFVDWLELERARLEQLYQDARLGYLEQLEGSRDIEKSISFAKDYLKTDPLNESVHRTVMRLEHKRGNSEAALAQFEELRQIVRDELGVEPLAETLELLQEIEQGGASRGKDVLVIETADKIPSLPEKLFGRDASIKDALGRLKKNERILLQGLGGAGKTALAAGLVHDYLKQKNTKVLWYELGNEDPDTMFEALARAFDAQQQMGQVESKANLIVELLKENSIDLLVLDDVWNAYSLSRLTDILPDDVPLVVTSRQRYSGLKRLDVGRLEREASLELLRFHANHSETPIVSSELPSASPLKRETKAQASPLRGGAAKQRRGQIEGTNKLDEENANKLCNLLGYHAFAIRIAGVTMNQENIHAKTLLNRIRRAPTATRYGHGR